MHGATAAVGLIARPVLGARRVAAGAFWAASSAPVVTRGTASARGAHVCVAVGGRRRRPCQCPAPSGSRRRGSSAPIRPIGVGPRYGAVHLALDVVRDRKLAIGEALSEFNQPPVAGDAGGQTERSRLAQTVAETELSAMMTCGVNVYMRQA